MGEGAEDVEENTVDNSVSLWIGFSLPLLKILIVLARDKLSYFSPVDPSQSLEGGDPDGEERGLVRCLFLTESRPVRGDIGIVVLVAVVPDVDIVANFAVADDSESL